MQLAIEIHPIETYEPFTLEVTQPGILRRLITGVKPASTVISTSMGQPPQAENRPIPALMFQVDPSQPKKTRHFMWLPVGVKLTYPGRLEFRDSYIDETTGSPLFLYEVMNAKP